MKCSKCGTDIEPGKYFCSKCGTAVIGAQEMAVAFDSENRINTVSTKPDRQGDGTGSFILGLMALIFDCLSCCLSLFLIPPLAVIILGILGIIFGNKGYKQHGWSKANAGKIMSIVALSMLIICIIINIVVILLFGVTFDLYYRSLPWYERIRY